MFDFSPNYYNPPVYLDPDSGEPVAQNKPFKQDGQTYMTIQDFTQSLNVVPHQDKNDTWFTYNNQLINIPGKGNEIKIDMQAINLDAPIISKDNLTWLPIKSLSKALAIEPVEYKSDEILFKQAESNGNQSIADTKTTAALQPTSYNTSDSAIAIAQEKGSTLSIGKPFSVPTPTGTGTLLNQIINGAQAGNSYSLTIKSPEMKNSTVYVSFANGTVDTKGTLTANGQNVNSTPMAITLDDNGEASLTYNVNAAPTNWDAYDNDNIVIANAPNTATASYRSEISVFS